MKTAVKTPKPKKYNVEKKLQYSDLSKIYGVLEGKIFCDDSIFNLGKRRYKDKIFYKNDEVLMTKEQMYSKIDKGIEEYKQGKTTKLDVSEIDSFLGL